MRKAKQDSTIARAGRTERFYQKLQQVFSRLVIKVYRVRIFHAEREPGPDAGNYLLCANHTAALDPFVLAAVLQKQQVHFMGKKELFQIPLFGRFLRQCGAYPVDRSGDVGAIRTTMTLLQSGKCVGMFPQGTRCPGRPPIQTADQLKHGAGMVCVRAGVTVLPVCIRAKGDKLHLFGGADILIGEPILFESFGVTGANRAEYERVTNIIFDRICALYDTDPTKESEHES